MPELFTQPIFIDNEGFKLDEAGSLIAGVHIDADKAYSELPDLLQKFINTQNEEVWSEIEKKIDYIYSGIFIMLNYLDEETNFMCKLQEEVKKNKILLFKPNIMSPDCISGYNHGAGSAYSLATKWPMVAAIMRWFHDNGNINYSQMGLIEGCNDLIASICNKTFSSQINKIITNEGILEGRVEGLVDGEIKTFDGGWGFYYVRKYLSSHCSQDESDNPMNGYEESCNGILLAPGEAKNKLMIYDINTLQEVPSRKRIVSVPDGKNFSKITINKIIIGGDPSNPDDIKLYPGSVIINVPVPKMHNNDLITNSIKNLGIALYPMKCAKSEDPLDTNWIYGSPNNKYPNTRAKLPHSPWVMKIDDETHLPIKDKNGKYISFKTAGSSGTQCDLLKALQNQEVFMIHISDNINITNITSSNGNTALPISEGFIWSSLDCVALDTFCANYCFKTLPRIYAKQLQEKYHLKTEFLQEVPFALIHKQNIITKKNVDSPLLRYSLYKDAEIRGIGSQLYHIKGLNLTTKSTLSSYKGHLIQEKNNNWYEFMTKALYYNYLTLLYNLQTTIFSYAKACDSLFNTNLYNELMNMLDENNDGVIDYNEQGRGFETAQLETFAYCLNLLITDEYGSLKSPYIQNISLLKNSNSCWNPNAQNFMKESIFLEKFSLAFKLSQQENQEKDLFYNKMIYGKGYWPSFKTVEYLYNMTYVYGGQSLKSISLSSPYGCLFQYCDIVKNSGNYTKNPSTALSDYFKDLNSGEKPLPFTFFVPHGFGKLNGIKVPNTIETNDPKLIFTAHFKEIW